MKREDQNRSGEYEKSYGGSSYNKDERSHYTIRKEETVPPKARKEETIPPRDAGSVSEETPEQQTAQKMKRAKTIYKKLFMAWLFLFLLSNVFTCIMDDDSLDEDVQSEETMDDPWGWEDEDMEEEDQMVPENEDSDDYIFCSSQLTPVSCKVDNSIKSSDHYPMICGLKMDGNAQK